MPREGSAAPHRAPGPVSGSLRAGSTRGAKPGRAAGCSVLQGSRHPAGTRGPPPPGARRQRGAQRCLPAAVSPGARRGGAGRGPRPRSVPGSALAPASLRPPPDARALAAAGGRGWRLSPSDPAAEEGRAARPAMGGREQGGPPKTRRPLKEGGGRFPHEHRVGVRRQEWGAWETDALRGGPLEPRAWERWGRELLLPPHPRHEGDGGAGSPASSARAGGP